MIFLLPPPPPPPIFKPFEVKADESKVVEAKVVEAKADEAKFVETKLIETKTVEAKTVKLKVVETKSVEAKADEAKFVETKALATKGNLVAWLGILIKREVTSAKGNTIEIKITAQISKPPIKETIIIEKATKKLNMLKTKTILGVAKNSKGQSLYKMKETLAIKIFKIF